MSKQSRSRRALRGTNTSSSSDSRDEHEGHRHSRLAQIVYEAVDELFRDEIGDPALASVTVTSVALAVDYRTARVHLATTEPADDAGFERIHLALARTTSFLRARLADELGIKRAPELRFIVTGAVS